MNPRPARHLAADLPPVVYWCGVAAAIVLQIALITTHDYFVDEWQALQIAVQSPDLPALLASLRYEGHPPLWYLLLRGLAWVVGPGQALMAASLICALTTLGIVAARAPLPRLARLAALLAEPILFEYGTVARSYALGVALIFVVLALWNRRRGVWLPLALLPLVDFLFGLMALALIALRVGERAQVWRPGIAAFVLCALTAAWSVLPAPDFISVYPPKGALETISRWMTEMAVVALPIQWAGGPRWDAPWVTPVTPVLGALFLYIAFDQTCRRPVERAVAIGFPLALLVFMLSVHTLAIRHLMLVAVMFVAVLWRQGEGGLAIRRPAGLWLAASALCGLLMAGFALTRPFDTAPRVATTIRALGLENETWLSFPAQHAQGVSALSGIGFEGVEKHCREDFIRWNYRHQVTDYAALRDWLTREASRGGTFYLLTQHRPAQSGPIDHVATVPAGLDGKIYHIFRVTGAKSGRRAIPPRCVPGTLPLRPLLRK